VDIALLGSTEATWQKYFELTTDLDFSKDETVTGSLIGTFYGTFDGKGHVIEDLNIDATGKTYVALFSSLAYGEIKNLGREGGSTTGSDAGSVGGLVTNVMRNGKLSNCYNSSSISINNTAGGLAYGLYDAIVQNCYNTGEINASGTQNGGLFGTCLYGGGRMDIINCYNAGNVNGSYTNGGTIGSINGSLGNKQIVNLSNSFNFGNITNNNDDNRAGSLIGYLSEANSALLEVTATNVYSRPDVVSVNETNKSNQPIGWNTSARENLKNAILLANPTMGENDKYSLEYSQSGSNGQK
jgi:hypothetical protein